MWKGKPLPHTAPKRRSSVGEGDDARRRWEVHVAVSVEIQPVPDIGQDGDEILERCQNKMEGEGVVGEDVEAEDVATKSWKKQTVRGDGVMNFRVCHITSARRSAVSA